MQTLQDKTDFELFRFLATLQVFYFPLKLEVTKLVGVTFLCVLDFQLDEWQDAIFGIPIERIEGHSRMSVCDQHVWHHNLFKISLSSPCISVTTIRQSALVLITIKKKSTVQMVVWDPLHLELFDGCVGEEWGRRLGRPVLVCCWSGCQWTRNLIWFHFLILMFYPREWICF